VFTEEHLNNENCTVTIKQDKIIHNQTSQLAIHNRDHAFLTAQHLLA